MPLQMQTGRKSSLERGGFQTFLLFFLSVAGGMGGALVSKPDHLFKWLLICTILLCGMLAGHWKSTGGLTEDRIVILLLLLAFAARLCYILSITITKNQHDTSWFGNPNINTGHTGYIRYLLEEGRLPGEEVRTRFQYYHPPLHHIVCAIWLKIQTSAGISFDAAAENLQILTLFYSMVTLYASYRILRLVGLRGMALIAPLCLLAFHPTFFLFSGSINNDCMSVMFCFLAVWAALRWFQKPTFLRITALALCIGCAMLAKLAAGLIAPAVALLFLYKLLTMKGWGAKGELLLQFCLFGVICIPLGIGWQVRNALLYDMPLAYVPRLSENADQYLGGYPTWTRFLDFGSLWDFGVYPMRTGVQGAEYFEHCIPLALQKMALFGEYSVWKDVGLYDVLGRLLFWVNAVIILATLVGAGSCVVFAVRGLRKSSEAPEDAPAVSFSERFGFGRMVLLFFLMYWVCTLGSYVKFCFSYPHFCSMDFRYIVPTLLIGAVFFGIVLRRLEERSGRVAKLLRTALLCCTAAFAICSTLLYPFVFGS